MITIYPLDGIDYSASDAATYNATRSSGVFTNDDFEISLLGTNEIAISQGLGWIALSRFDGKSFCMKEPTQIQLEPAESSLSRVDTVALVFENNKMEVKVLKGKPSGNPLPVAPTRNSGRYELHLYHIIRNAGATIDSPDVIDLRPNPIYCGYMADAVSKVDETLSKAGWLADAKTVGDKLKQEAKVVRPVWAGGTGTNTNRIKLKTKQRDIGASSTVEAFYIPYLKMGFIRIIATTTSLLNAGDVINVCNLVDSKYAPEPRTKNPLNARCVSRSAPSKNYPVEAMMSNEGYIELASIGEQIPKGKEFYIWGFWFAG